jgi:hypothetical protein
MIGQIELYNVCRHGTLRRISIADRICAARHHDGGFRYPLPEATAFAAAVGRGSAGSHRAAGVPSMR